MAERKKSPAKKSAQGKGKGGTTGKKAAPKKATVKKPAPRKPVARKAAPKKPPVRKAAAKNQKTAGASAPGGKASGNVGGDASPNRETPRHGFESVKPQIAAAAETIESKISDLIDKADVQDFPDKLWRLAAMIAFAFVGYWVFVVVAILAAMQWVVVLLGDKPSPEIAHYMERCSAYIRQVLDLLSYRSEILPWPLGPLPGDDAEE